MPSLNARPRTNHQSQTTYLRQGSLVLIGSIVGGYIADYMLNLTLARLLSPQEYGDFKIAYAFAFTSSFIVLLGGDRVAPKFLSAQLQKLNNQSVWEYLLLYTKIALALSVIVILATAIGTFFHLGSFNRQHHHSVLKISLVIPLLAVVTLLSRVLQSAKHLAASNFPLRIGFPLLSAVLILAAYFLGSPPTIDLALSLAVFSMLVVCILQWSLIRRWNLVSLKRLRGAFPPKQTLTVSVPMMLVMLVGVAMTQIDLFLMELISTEDQVGHYATAILLAHAVMLVQVTVMGLHVPLIGPAIERGGKVEVDTFKRALKQLAVIAIPVAVFLIAFREPLLEQFGHKFTDASSAVVILVIGYLAWALAGPSSTWLQYAGKGKVVVAISVVCFSLNATLNIALIPKLGMDGAAIGTSAGMISGSLALVFAHFHLRVLRKEAKP